MNRGELAAQNFRSGCNCAQAVLLAFSDLTGLEDVTAMKLASSFGGGMGRLREVCGAVSGMALVAGLLYGIPDPNDAAAKRAHYQLVQLLAQRFREKTGSIICREILKNPPADPVPSPRTPEYYADRPCARMVMLAASILDDYIAEHPVANG